MEGVGYGGMGYGRCGIWKVWDIHVHVHVYAWVSEYCTRMVMGEWGEYM